MKKRGDEGRLEPNKTTAKTAWAQRKIRLMEGNAKCRHLKK
jgi:hypothetical protein